MNPNTMIFEAAITERNGAKVAGVRVELPKNEIPPSIRKLIKKK